MGDGVNSKKKEGKNLRMQEMLYGPRYFGNGCIQKKIINYVSVSILILSFIILHYEEAFIFEMILWTT